MSLTKTYFLKCLSQYSQHPIANHYLAMVYKSKKNYALEKQYLLAAKKAFEEGYAINEDNRFYANFPYEIKLYEVNLALANCK